MECEIVLRPSDGNYSGVCQNRTQEGTGPVQEQLLPEAELGT